MILVDINMFKLVIDIIRSSLEIVELIRVIVESETRRKR